MDFETSSHRRHWLFAAEHLAEVRIRAHKDALRKVILAHHISARTLDNAGERESMDTTVTQNDMSAVPTSLVAAQRATQTALPAKALNLFEERLLLIRALGKLYQVCTDKESFRAPIHPRVLACALSLTQRFFVLQSMMQHDPIQVAAAALFLAGKVEERYVDRHSVAKAFGIEEIELSQMEPFLLGGVHFDINVFSPFPVVTALVKSFEDLMKEQTQAAELCAEILQQTRSQFQSVLALGKDIDTGATSDIKVVPPFLATSISATDETSVDDEGTASLSSNSTNSLPISSRTTTRLVDFWKFMVDRTRILLLRMYLTDAIFLMTPAQLAYGALIHAAERVGKELMDYRQQGDTGAGGSTRQLILDHGSNAVWLHAFLMSPLALPNSDTSERKESSAFMVLSNRIIPSTATAIEQGKVISEASSRLSNTALDEIAERAATLRKTYLASLRDGEVKQILLADSKRSSRFAELAQKRQAEEDRLLIGTPLNPTRPDAANSANSATTESTPMFLHRGDLGSRFETVTPSPMGGSREPTSANSIDIGLRRGRLDMDATPGSVMGTESRPTDDATQRLKRIRDEATMTVSPQNM